MADQQAPPAGPDLTQGVTLSEFAGETLLGHVGDEEVLLVRAGRRCSRSARIAATITGRSPRAWWSATPCAAPGITPASTCAPARPRARRRSVPIAAGRSSSEDDAIFVREKREQPKPQAKRAGDAPGKIVIVGGGAAGFAAAEMLRRQDYRGSIVMLSNDAARAGRSAEPVEGLSRRQRAGGLAAAARRTTSTPRQRHRPAAQDRGHVDRHQRTRSRPRRRRARSPTTAAAGDRRRAGAAADPGRRPAACPHAALARRLPRDHRIGRRRARARS